MGAMRTSILARIDSETTSFKQVKDVADIESVLHSTGARTELNLRSLPAALLHLSDQSADEALVRMGGFTQEVVNRWGVLIVTRARNNVGGGKAAALADDLINELDAALCGFKPDGASGVMEKSRSAARLISWNSDLYFMGAYYEVPSRICLSRGN